MLPARQSQAQGGMGYLVQLLRNVILYPPNGFEGPMAEQMNQFNCVNVWDNSDSAFHWGTEFNNLRSEASDSTCTAGPARISPDCCCILLRLAP